MGIPAGTVAAPLHGPLCKEERFGFTPVAASGMPESAVCIMRPAAAMLQARSSHCWRTCSDQARHKQGSAPVSGEQRICKEEMGGSDASTPQHGSWWQV